VRASLPDLDAVQALLEIVGTAPPQANIKATFVQIPTEGFDQFLGTLGLTNRPGNASTQQVTAILTAAQARDALSALERRPDADVINQGQITTPPRWRLRASLSPRNSFSTVDAPSPPQTA